MHIPWPHTQSSHAGALDWTQKSSTRIAFQEYLMPLEIHCLLEQWSHFTDTCLNHQGALKMILMPGPCPQPVNSECWTLARACTCSQNCQGDQLQLDVRASTWHWCDDYSPPDNSSSEKWESLGALNVFSCHISFLKSTPLPSTRFSYL